MNNTFKEEVIYLESISELIFELNEEYVPNTIVAITENGTNIGVNELGGKFIEIDGSLLTVGDKISIQYTILKEMGDEKKSIKIRELEKKVSLLSQQIIDLEKAVNNRINIDTFTAWKTLIEEKLGIDLKENLFPTYDGNRRTFKRNS